MQKTAYDMRISDWSSDVCSSYLDGGEPREIRVPIGVDHDISFNREHGGQSVFEIAVSPGSRELTLENNRAVVAVSGVRDRLRVLLVSGEPHPGERTWRNLLKSDPSVDLDRKSTRLNSSH